MPWCLSSDARGVIYILYTAVAREQTPARRRKSVNDVSTVHRHSSIVCVAGRQPTTTCIVRMVLLSVFRRMSWSIVSNAAVRSCSSSTTPWHCTGLHSRAHAGVLSQCYSYLGRLIVTACASCFRAYVQSTGLPQSSRLASIKSTSWK